MLAREPQRRRFSAGGREMARLRNRSGSGSMRNRSGSTSGGGMRKRAGTVAGHRPLKNEVPSAVTGDEEHGPIQVGIVTLRAVDQPASTTDCVREADRVAFSCVAAKNYIL